MQIIQLRLSFLFLFTCMRAVTSFLGNPTRIAIRRHSSRTSSFSVLSTSDNVLSGVTESERPSKLCVFGYDADTILSNCGREFSLDAIKSVATDLSSRLSAPLITQRSGKSDFSFGIFVVPYLHGSIESYAIGVDSLASAESISKRKSKMPSLAAKPYIIDFCPPSGSTVVKRGMGQTGGDLLVKAVAPKRLRENGAFVLDLTAGFGQDSLVLAQCGASQVRMVERDVIVSTLLKDALRRLHLLTKSDDFEVQNRAVYLSRRLSLIEGDGYQEASRIALSPGERPDICYLDTMFPPRTKTAKVKKGMQLLHGLLDSQNVTTDPLLLEQTEAELLKAAYDAALHRVVVKRPKNAPTFGGTVLEPTHHVIGSVNRWDVYSKI